MRAEVVADGQPPLPSDEVVSKVLLQNRSNITFLKNAGILTPSSKSQSASEEALHEELTAEKQDLAALHQELEELKEKSEAVDETLARTQRQYEELKKQQGEESNLILTKLLTLNNPGVSSQP
jgi:septal ring factor EnvC (AmiA/AmiB activator)